MDTKEIVIIGAEGIGKTTLANALLGWDILPQSNDEIYVPTTENASQMLTENIQLTDTPGYDYRWNHLPEDVLKAVCQADTIIVLLNQMLVTEDEPEEVLTEQEEEDLAAAVKDWEEDLEQQRTLVKTLLKKSKTKDIFFVIPYDTEELSGEPISLTLSLQTAREYYSDMTDNGDAGVFCIDPMKALVAAIEADDTAIAQSGILSLKAALLGEENGC